MMKGKFEKNIGGGLVTILIETIPIALLKMESPCCIKSDFSLVRSGFRISIISILVDDY